MKIERTKNATRNIIFGGMLKVYQIAVPFLMRTAMIYFMGVQYLGLNSLFTSVLQVLNLAELGVGSAMVYSMYKPIAEDDKEKICALMRLYRLYYRIIGLVIGVLGLFLLPFIPNLIKGNVPDGINVYILYLLNLASTVVSYWLFAYKNCLLEAHQRVDISSKVVLLTNTAQYLVQFAVLYFARNYYLYLLVALLTQATTNIVTAAVATKIFPDYKARGRLDSMEVKNINQKIKDLFTTKIGGVIVDSADTIVISAFLGLTILAIYQNYFYILNSVRGFISIIFVACTAGIGNSIIVESKNKNYNDFKRFTFLIVWISGVCVCCLMGLYQPFMEIWVGEDMQLEFSAVICFCIYFFISEINQLLNTYKDAAGIWHTDRFRPLVTALTNLAMNLFMVQFWGIYGVLLSTVLSTLCVGMPWLLHNLFTKLFDRSKLKDYLEHLLFYVLISVLVCAINGLICSYINLGKWGTFFIRGVICVIFPNVIFYAIYRNSKDFQEAVYFVERMAKGKIPLRKLFLKKGK